MNVVVEQEFRDALAGAIAQSPYRKSIRGLARHVNEQVLQMRKGTDPVKRILAEMISDTLNASTITRALSGECEMDSTTLWRITRLGLNLSEEECQKLEQLRKQSVVRTTEPLMVAITRKR